jgi:hypothetical protein
MTVAELGEENEERLRRMQTLTSLEPRAGRDAFEPSFYLHLNFTNLSLTLLNFGW